MQAEHTKINTIKYNSFKMQPYLDSEILTTEQISMLFNMRSNTVNGFKMCFSSLYRNDTSCKLGCQEQDSLDHCMRCKIISQKIGGNLIVEIAAIFSTEIEQRITVAEFIKRMNIRAALLKGSWAYQGTQILDTSTTAMAGGAEDRRGPL